MSNSCDPLDDSLPASSVYGIDQARLLGWVAIPFSNSILLLLFIHLLNKGMRQKQGWLMNKLFSSVQFSSVAQSCPILCDPIDRSTPGLPVHHQLLEPTQTYVHWGSDAIQTSHSLSSPSPPAFNLSQHQSLFKEELALRMRWPKNWSFSFSISPSNEYPELISFRMDWLDLLAVQGTLKSLLQHHSSKASILWRSAFFTVNSYIHTWPLEKP